jgi:hypothetical protein
MRLRSTSSAIATGSMASLRADCAPGASGTCLPHQPRLGRMVLPTADRIDRRECVDHIIVLGEMHLRYPAILCRLLQRRQNTSVVGEGCAGLSPASADRKHQIASQPWWTTSPLRSSLSFRYTNCYTYLKIVFCWNEHSNFRSVEAEHKIGYVLRYLAKSSEMSLITILVAIV